MSYPWIPNSSDEIVKEMLKTIGVSSIDDLYTDLPKELVIDERRWNSLRIGLGRPLSEVEVSRIVNSELNKVVQLRIPPFAGGGLKPHYVPPTVRYLVERGEFLTAYTPYQPEISQGLLQALFEYQSLMADLFDMDVVNASMYDWASSLGEAALMSVRVKGVKRVVVPEVINPFHLSSLRAYTWPQGIEVDTYRISPDTGYADLEDLKEKLSKGASALYIEYPYTFTGVVDANAKAMAEIAHDSKALAIVGADPIAVALYKSPGELGADITVSDGQQLGLGLFAGGATVGVLGVRWDGELIKQMPGRIIGLTTTKDGRGRAFSMILQTREQHIRRSKATSNITTNSSLNAIAVAIYVSLLGPKGIRELAEAMWYRAHYASEMLSKVPHFSLPFKGEFFSDFIIDVSSVNYYDAWRQLLRDGIMAGIPISRYVSWARPTWGLLGFSELHSKDDINELVSKLKEVSP